MLNGGVYIYFELLYFLRLFPFWKLSYQVLISVSTDELAFGLGGEETGVIRLLFLHRLSLLRYVVIVGHSSLFAVLGYYRKISSVMVNGGMGIYYLLLL